MSEKRWLFVSNTQLLSKKTQLFVLFCTDLSLMSITIAEGEYSIIYKGVTKRPKVGFCEQEVGFRKTPGALVISLELKKVQNEWKNTTFLNFLFFFVQIWVSCRLPLREAIFYNLQRCHKASKSWFLWTEVGFQKNARRNGNLSGGK